MLRSTFMATFFLYLLSKSRRMYYAVPVFSFVIVSLKTPFGSNMWNYAKKKGKLMFFLILSSENLFHNCILKKAT